MKSKIVRKMFISTMIILFLNNLTTTLGTLVDGIIISKLLGDVSMAAYGLVAPILFIVAAIGIIFATGSQMLISRFMGGGNVEKANKVFSVMTVIVSIISVALVGFFFAMQNPLIKMLGTTGENAELFDPAKGYLLGLTIGIPAILFVTCYSPLLQLDRDGNRALVAVIAMTLFNIGGDLLNVYVLKWGTFGMGLVTSLSYYVAFVIILFHFRKGKTCFKFSIKKLYWKSTGQMIKTGLPTAIKCASNTFRISILNAILISIASVSSVAALSIQMNLHAVFSSIGIGVGSAALMITGVFMGENDEKEIKNVMKIGTILGFLVSFVAALLLFIFAPQIIKIYSEPGSDVYAEAVRCVRFYAPYIILFTLNSLFISVSQACENLILAHILNALDLFGFPVLVAFVFSRFMGVDGVWLCSLIGSALTMLTIFVVSSIKSKKIAIKPSDYVLFSRKIAVDENDVYLKTVANMEEAVEASKEAYKFCELKNGEHTVCYNLSLFVEEMCSHIIEFGFVDKKKHTIDLRIVFDGKDFILRLRDDCKPINFDQKIQMKDSINSEKGIGIKLIMECAKEIKYVNTINTNNIFITL